MCTFVVNVCNYLGLHVCCAICGCAQPSVKADAPAYVNAGIYFSGATKLPSGVAIGVIVLFCFFISSFAWSWGPLGWLVPSEIHPLETRSAGQGINVAVNL